MSYEALKKRCDQGWVQEMIDDVEALIQRIKEARRNREVKSLEHVSPSNPSSNAECATKRI